jgi:hypothetical protein
VTLSAYISSVLKSISATPLTVKVVVPDTDDSHKNRQILLERRGLEVLVHRVRAAEELLKVLEADHERDAEADRGPERVAAADPVPEREHVRGVDPERSHRLRVRAERDKVLRDVRLVARARQEPRARALRVRDRLLRRERLGGDDEERALGVARAQRLREVRAVDVRDEVGRDVALGVRLERLGDHHRPEVGAADADVHDGVDALAGVPLPGAGAHGVAEVAERDVEYGAVLGRVDVLAGEHLVAVRLHLRLAREREQGLEDGRGDQVLGVVEQEGRIRAGLGVVLGAELGEAFRVLREEVLENELGMLRLVDLLELLPRRVLCTSCWFKQENKIERLHTGSQTTAHVGRGESSR